jgi:uncharacterized repeat protein (TIGR01451 family)
MTTPSRIATQGLILVDGASGDLTPLLEGARLPAATIPPCSNPLGAIGEQLRAKAGSLPGRSITLHLVAHGQPGAIFLGGQRIDTTALTQAAAELAQWGVDEIVLWSCRTGADRSFVATMAELSGARVLASEALLGHYQPALIDGKLCHGLADLFQPEVLERWGGTLINEYDVKGKQLNFSFANAKLIPNGGGLISGSYALNTKFYYDNIVTVKDANGNDVKIGAVVTYLNRTSRTSLKVFDSSLYQYNTTAFAQADAFLQPNLEILNQRPLVEEGLADFNIQFVEEFDMTTYTGEAVLLDNLSIDIYDIDGNGLTSSPRQFVEIDTVGSYSLLSPSSVTTGSKLDVVATPTGIRFQAKITDGTNYTQLPGTTAGDAIRVNLNYDNGISEFRFQIGDYNYSQSVGTLSNAYYALNFGTNVAWSGPTYSYGLKAFDTSVSECGDTSLITVCIVGPDANTPQSNITVDLLDFISKSPVGSLANVVTNPDGSVVVNNEFLLSRTQLVFTPANWQTPQTITVTGLDDGAFDGDFRFQALLKATTTDNYYTGISTAVTIKNLDNDIAIDGCTLLQTTPWACFDIKTFAGRTLQFNAIDGTTTGIAGAIIEISSNGGLSWINYCNTTNSTKLEADVYKVPGTGIVDIKVRVAVSPTAVANGNASNTFDLKVTSPGVTCDALATATLVAPASLGNRVWLDANANGLQDPGEKGLAGVSVELFKSINGTSSETPLASTVSAADGSYSFTNLVPDAYIVRFAGSDAQLLVPANLGDDSLDSDAAADGFTPTYNLVSGENNDSVDAGFLSYASLSGTIYHDLNNDGVQNPGENGIGGVVIRLNGVDCFGNAVDLSAISGSDGSYSFSNLIGGSYSVAETQPAGFLDGIDSVGSSGGSLGHDLISAINLAAGSDATAYNFGEIKPSSISGVVFHDLDNNGLQASDELGISGVTVTLNGSDDLGAPVALTAITDAAGSYSFANLRPGTYSLTESQPTGFIDGIDSVGSSGGSLANDLISAINLGQDISANGYNFGEIKPSSISGGVFHDLDNNGLQTSDELGISDVTVTLNGSDDLGAPVSLTAITDAAGSYSFANLRPGTYSLTESQPTGFLDGKDSVGSSGGSLGNDLISAINLGQDTSANGYNFGEIKPSSISGLVFHDLDNNGLQTSAELGISDVTVTLNGSDDLGAPVSLTAITDAAGSYSFANLRPGTYSLSESQPTDFIDGIDSVGSSGGSLGHDLISAINLGQDTSANGYNFGEIKSSSISGVVFHDLDNNGLQTSAELGISGVTVTLNGSDDLGAPVSLTATTDAAGSYSFANLRPGTYSLSESQPTDFIDGIDSVGSSGGSLGNDLISAINLGQDTTANGYNFGEIKTASIGDRFWLDSNADGIQNDGASGLGGYTVTLIGGGADGLLSTAADNTSISTVTGADGLYGFANLLPGEYRVHFGDRPAGSVFSPADAGASDALDSDVNGSGDSPVLILLSGQVNTTIDAGVYQSVSFGDLIWEDGNGDGIQNGTEQGLAGVKVYLTDGSGNRISAGGVPMSTTTASDGSYSFSSLTPGSYGIEVERPTGYQFTARDRGVDDSFDSDVDGTTGKSSILTLLSGQSNSDLDAGLFRPVSLGDKIWHDLNANGTQDVGEPGISGVTVYLTDISGSRILQNGLPIQHTTDSNGLYSFTGLTPGSYGVEVVKPSGYAAFASKGEGSDPALDSDLNAAGKSDPVELNSGDVETSIDGGLYKLASLGDRVWGDTNANGIQDAGEVGTSGLTVELYDPSGANLLQSTTTNPSGLYSFAGLTPGDYVLRFSKPADAYFSDTGNGTTSTDNDAGADGYTSVISLASGDNNTSIDAGWNKLGSIGDFVWLDSNANGVQDGSELGYGGLQVDLYDERNTTWLATTTTANDGSYQFSGLKAAKYVVRFSKPADYLFSDKTPGGNELLDSDADSSGKTAAITVNSGQAVTNVDAGIYKLASIGDRIWNDANSNGIQDSNESGLANVNVGLYKADGITLLSSTISNSSGNYSFGSLRPGDYVVKVTKPSAYTVTSKGSDASSGSDSNIDGSGKTDVITLNSGDINASIDAGLFLTPSTGSSSDLQITKSDGLTSVVAGQQITYTVVVKNVGSTAVSNVLVSDLMPTNLSGVTWSSKVDYGTVSGNDAAGSGNINDTITSLGANSCVTYTVNATVVKPGTNPSSAITSFDFKAASDSAKSGTAANSRTFSSGGVTVTTRAFSREALSCGTVTWSNAYLGAYTTGLGVTNTAETTSDYRLDNVGSRKDYLLLQFSESVILDKAAIKSILSDSDATVWIGTSSTLSSLSDAVLTALGTAEQSSGGSADRTADLNATNKVGNTIVISAANNETGNDNVTLAGIDIYKLILSSSSISNTATVSGPSGFQDSNTSNNSATDLTGILTAPGTRTPGFWVNKTWQTFWDGISNNQPSQAGSAGFATGDIFCAPYKSGSQGTVRDPISGSTLAGVLIGDHNRNGLTDSGEQTIFYTTAEALKILDSAQQPDKGDVRYTVTRSLVASWLNYQAGNPIDTAASSDRDARFWINQGISWLQTYTPDENKDGKGDGMLSKLSPLSSPSMKASNSNWTNANLGGNVINSNLDAYNKGSSILADGNVYGGAI